MNVSIYLSIYPCAQRQLWLCANGCVYAILASCTNDLHTYLFTDSLRNAVCLCFVGNRLILNTLHEQLCTVIITETTSTAIREAGVRCDLWAQVKCGGRYARLDARLASRALYSQSKIITAFWPRPTFLLTCSDLFLAAGTRN